MREIKFRGKSKNVNEWCYGTYIFTDDNTNDPFRTRPFKESHRIVFWCDGDWNMGGWDYEEVIPETIGQYTGLKDKNGKEIYEGDIIKHSYWEMAPLDMYQQGEKDEWIEEVGVVKWDSNDCKFYTIAFDVNIWSCDDYEVIGNIYDNPKLIKEEEK